jgi:hypothetical protein
MLGRNATQVSRKGQPAAFIYKITQNRPPRYFTKTTPANLVAIAGLAMGGGVWGPRMWRLTGQHADAAERNKLVERVSLLGETDWRRDVETDKLYARICEVEFDKLSGSLDWPLRPPCAKS